MRFIRVVAILIALQGGVPAMAKVAPSRAQLPNGEMAIQDLKLAVPAQWQKEQDALNGDTLLLGFSHDEDYVSLYAVRRTGLSLRKFAVNNSTVTEAEATEAHGDLQWTRLATTKS